MQQDFIMEVRLLLMHLKMKYFHFTMKKVSLKMRIKMILGMKMVLLIAENLID